ncbi:MAG TPA: hypothetical protein VNA14_11860 [Mycobacteriales bacterium]|nr:hypothetical protein [Mycobacteriales bacterium]
MASSVLVGMSPATADTQRDFSHSISTHPGVSHSVAANVATFDAAGVKNGYGATASCAVQGLFEPNVTGQTYQLTVTGLAATGHNVPGETVGSVGVTCTVRNGEGLSYSMEASGSGIGAGSWTLSLAGADFSVCASATAVYGARVFRTRPTCTSGGGAPIQVPPQVVYDTIDAVWAEVKALVDPVVCSVARDLAGNYGPAVVNIQGDVYVNGERVHDCPPYEVDWRD